MTAQLLHPAYVAGIIDGEGSIFVRWQHGSTLGNPHVSVANTSKPLIDSLALIGGYINDRDPARGIGNLPSWEWTCSGETAAIVLRACLPYLLVKGHKAEMALAEWAVPRSGNSNRFREKARNGVVESGWLPVDHPALKLTTPRERHIDMEAA